MCPSFSFRQDCNTSRSHGHKGQRRDFAVVPTTIADQRFAASLSLGAISFLVGEDIDGEPVSEEQVDLLVRRLGR